MCIWSLHWEFIYWWDIFLYWNAPFVPEKCRTFRVKKLYWDKMVGRSSYLYNGYSNMNKTLSLYWNKPWNSYIISYICYITPCDINVAKEVNQLGDEICMIQGLKPYDFFANSMFIPPQSKYLMPRVQDDQLTSRNNIPHYQIHFNWLAKVNSQPDCKTILALWHQDCQWDGYETLPPIGWEHLFIICWFKYRLG